MNTPMMGSWSVEVMAVHPFAIHGDPYYELHVVRVDAPGTPAVALRVAQHAVRVTPEVGQRLSISFLAGQVTAVKPLA